MRIALDLMYCFIRSFNFEIFAPKYFLKDIDIGRTAGCKACCSLEPHDPKFKFSVRNTSWISMYSSLTVLVPGVFKNLCSIVQRDGASFIYLRAMPIDAIALFFFQICRSVRLRFIPSVITDTSY